MTTKTTDHTDEFRAAVRAIVDRAPKATPEQRDQIKAVLRPLRESKVHAA